ncbi:hypothetical protein [Serratia nevei]|uniref:hypothetical protein n=1 Tax=Serratia nevei TaxID=2703794 RepID=UPI002928EC41|nr:hypothetical protein [Serratia marcescens]
MKIQNEINETILLTLRDYFPHALMSDGYARLLAQFDEDVLDGHMIYLSQKGLISLPSKYRYVDADGYEVSDLDPERGQGRWAFMTKDVFITATGIDYLYSINK